ncbi:alpha-glucuronidase precursor [Fusarium circinatum]|uniref:Alpha-glucuronidase n=1 Tax=Fusarium circinatum TaxID=48490 RepID=A0A8H5WDL6_FUSCI|nr:alpha-glucuronidase precursor [Fusarium circinatum]
MLHPETGIDAWLRYAPLSEGLHSLHKPVSSIIALSTNPSSPVFVAGKELQCGLERILRQSVQVESRLDADTGRSIIVGILSTLQANGGDRLLQSVPALDEDGFWLDINVDGSNGIQIVCQNERGALYGAFEYLSLLAQGKLAKANLHQAYNPGAPIRYVNEWDNLDGSIERGYGGKSIFFCDGEVLKDLSRVRQYARLLASIRINGCIVNNVNSSHNLLNETNFDGLGRIADIMRPYGVRIGVSLFFDTPRGLAGLPTSDPLDPDVIKFWEDITAKLYKRVLDMLGYTIKANSEGQPGPLTYSRTLAQGANMFARALKPHDFQIREPPSTLFANLRKTPVICEFMVCQEYLGQQSHYVYMAPEWETILGFDMRIEDKPSLVRDIASGKVHGLNKGGYAAVTNIGDDPTWLGHHLSMSNLYAYGRLCWDAAAPAQDILLDWIRLTFTAENQKVIDTIREIGMESWPTYEAYSDGNGWGQWTRADSKALGMDRTAATGTGYAAQYPPQVTAQFESIEITPDDLLLWFHHVPYTHKLKSGHSLVWRDSVNNFYLAKCGIPDDKNRVGNYPWRIEAESMQLNGYTIVGVTPPEAASGGRAIVALSLEKAVVTTTITFPSRRYDVAVNYFDHTGGHARYEVLLDGKAVGEWTSDLDTRLGHDFSEHLDGHSATRVYFRGVDVREGSELTVIGYPDGKDMASLDYVSVLPEGVVD